MTIQIVAFPQEGMYAYKGGKTPPLKRRGMTHAKEFWESDINVCFGQDSINDPWFSIGNGEHLFKKPEPSYEIEIDLFRKIRELRSGHYQEATSSNKCLKIIRLQLRLFVALHRTKLVKAF